MLSLLLIIVGILIGIGALVFAVITVYRASAGQRYYVRKQVVRSYGRELGMTLVVGSFGSFLVLIGMILAGLSEILQ